jgi:hypothetical protein
VVGNLSRWGDTVLLYNATWFGRGWWRLALNLPEGWSVEPGEGDELEVVDGKGAVVARTGELAAFTAENVPDMPSPLVRDNVLAVCGRGDLAP